MKKKIMKAINVDKNNKLIVKNYNKILLRIRILKKYL